MAKPSKTTATKAGAKGVAKVAGSRTGRRAAKGTARVTWLVGKKAAKRVAKRKAKKHARRYGDAARTARAAALIYGPMAAEVLGLVEPPKRRPRFPLFLAGAAAGAGAMYVAGRRLTAS